MAQIKKNLRNLWIVLFLPLAVYSQTRPPGQYLWYEAENRRGFSAGKRGEPRLNRAHLTLPGEKGPGWGINGPAVSAEWTQGGDRQWNSAPASADESRAPLYQD